LGIVCALQLLPFHCSAAVAPLPKPTAVQSVAVGQDTASRTAVPGVDSIAHALPFHCSASVDCWLTIRQGSLRQLQTRST